MTFFFYLIFIFSMHFNYSAFLLILFVYFFFLSFKPHSGSNKCFNHFSNACLARVSLSSINFFLTSKSCYIKSLELIIALSLDAYRYHFKWWLFLRDENRLMTNRMLTSKNRSTKANQDALIHYSLSVFIRFFFLFSNIITVCWYWYRNFWNAFWACSDAAVRFCFENVFYSIIVDAIIGK